MHRRERSGGAFALASQAVSVFVVKFIVVSAVPCSAAAHVVYMQRRFDSAQQSDVRPTHVTPDASSAQMVLEQSAARTSGRFIRVARAMATVSMQARVVSSKDRRQRILSKLRVKASLPSLQARRAARESSSLARRAWLGGLRGHRRKL
jgi:hypothetical protein